MIHKNTQWLMEWADRMNRKYGPPQNGMEWCHKLSYAVGEEGQDHPSDEALRLAREWETFSDWIAQNVDWIDQNVEETKSKT